MIPSVVRQRQRRRLHHPTTTHRLGHRRRHRRHLRHTTPPSNITVNVAVAVDSTPAPTGRQLTPAVTVEPPSPSPSPSRPPCRHQRTGRIDHVGDPRRRRQRHRRRRHRPRRHTSPGSPPASAGDHRRARHIADEHHRHVATSDPTSRVHPAGNGSGHANPGVIQRRRHRHRLALRIRTAGAAV